MWRWWVVCPSLGVLLHAVVALAGGVEPRPFGSPSTILIDADTGRTLSEEDADVPHPTRGLNQLMVLLLGIEQVEMGTLSLTTPVTVGPLAAGHGNEPSRLPLQADKTYLLGDLMMAMLVGSAGDAGLAVAEAVAGTLPACLDMMNARAQRLGMVATHYGDLTGDRPDAGNEPDTTTARDVARLAQTLLRHPPIRKWASVSGFPFDHGAIVLRNANQLVGALNGVDGLLATSVGGIGGRTAPSHTTTSHAATSHAATSRTTTPGSAARRSAPARALAGRPAMFDIVATAQRQSLRLLAVVLGAPDSATRYKKAVELLDAGFDRYERVDLVKRGEPLNVVIGVANGVPAQLTPVAGQALSLLRRRDEERDLQVRYQVPTVIAAPVKRHQVLGELIVEEHGALVAVVPVVSPQPVDASSVLSAALR